MFEAHCLLAKSRRLSAIRVLIAGLMRVNRSRVRMPKRADDTLRPAAVMGMAVFAVLMVMAVHMIVVMRMVVLMMVAVLMTVMMSIMSVAVAVIAMPMVVMMVIVMVMIVLMMAMSVFVRFIRLVKQLSGRMRMFAMMMVMLGFMPVMLMIVLQLSMAYLIFVQEWIETADNDPQDVRLIRKIPGTGPVADRFDNHRRQPFAELVGQPADDSCAGRRRHFHRIRGWSDRQSLHHFQRRWRGDRVDAVIAAYRPRTERNRRADDFLDLERVDRKRYADDIDDGVDGADFVEVNRFDRNIMYFGLGDRNFLENRQAQLDDALIKAGAVNDLDNFRIVTVMFGRTVRVEQHIHFHGRDAAFVHALPFKGERLDVDFPQLLVDVIAIGSSVDQRRQRHIPANAGKAIQITYFHRHPSLPASKPADDLEFL